MARIFLSYRRDDSSGHAGRLYDRLCQHFGADNIFIDLDTIAPGFDFVKTIQDAVGVCEVLLAVIGRQWLTSTDTLGHRRLDNPEDFVRLEIVTAIERKTRVIPVLVGGASMPRSTELPDVLQPLARLQALEVGNHFHHDVNRVIKVLEKVLNTTNSIGMEFVRIPAGTFLLGSPDTDTEAQPDEKPAHHVTISQPFYLGKYPVTQAQWEAVMGNNPSRLSVWLWSHPHYPEVSVSWSDAQEFMRRLNDVERVDDYRLPTEAEWEYACRAGTEIPRYHQDIDAVAWYAANSNGHPQPVGQKLPNAWGLYDMLGNVWEWCHDGKRTYTADAIVDPMGPTHVKVAGFVGSIAINRAMKGGCWNSPAQHVRVSTRNKDLPILTNLFITNTIGFRCMHSVRWR